MKRAAALKKGEVIGIAAPASPFDKEKFNKGISLLREMGFDAFYRQDIFESLRYLAGTDQRRATELMDLFQRKEVKAILLARGGYGSQRIIPLLDKEVIRANAKPVVGFSDATALLNYLRQDCEAPTFYGPVLTQIAEERDDLTFKQLFKALTNKEPLLNMPGPGATSLKSGRAQGLLVGGCLSLINSSIGTFYDLITSGAILFVEDENEKVYVLDRMLTQLKNSGKLDQVKGIIIGSLGRDNDDDLLREMLLDVLADFNGPVVINYPAGHTKPFVTLPLGIEAVLEAVEDKEPTLKILTTLLS